MQAVKCVSCHECCGSSNGACDMSLGGDTCLWVAFLPGSTPPWPDPVEGRPVLMSKGRHGREAEDDMLAGR